MTEYQRLFNGGKKIPDLRQYLQDWKGSVKKTVTSVNLVRDYYKLLNLLGVHDVDPDDPVGSARLGTLARFSQILADFEHVKRRSRYVDENGAKVFRCGQDRGEWFYRQLFMLSYSLPRSCPCASPPPLAMAMRMIGGIRFS